MVSVGHRPRVLMIGLDAADIDLIERWIADGSLPSLRALRERGAFGRLASTADWLVGSPWPTFYTGTSPAEHGRYYYLIWRPENMSTELPSSDWMPLRPFWRNLGAHRHAIAIDIPLVYPPEPFSGVEVSGWATHDLPTPHATYPSQLRRWIRAEFGPPPRDNEEFHRLTDAELASLRRRWIDVTRRVTNLGVALMERHPWNLFLICLGATHRGGHRLWDATSAPQGVNGAGRPEPHSGLKDIYVACDAAVGRLVEQAGEETVTLVFSLHGMGPNTSRVELLAEMLRRILAEGGRDSQSASLVRASAWARELLPVRLRSSVKSRLPLTMQQSLTAFWRTGGLDWKATRAFAMCSDLYGYVRVNLRGREASGIVEPGEEYERLCTRIETGLRSFVDADTSEPIVRDLMQMSTLYPTGRMQAYLPDIVVRWSSRSASEHRLIASARYGSISWPTPGAHPSHRTGNHRPDGFMLASGGDIAPGTRLDHAHILDLAPTAYALLDLPVPTELPGRALFHTSRRGTA